MNTSSPVVSTYYVESHYLTVVYVTAIPIMLLIDLIMGLASLRSPQSYVIMALFFTFQLIAIWNIVRWQRETWLTVTPDGLIYHTSGLTIHTSWENIERIEDRVGNMECRLRQRAATSLSLWVRFSRWISSTYWNIDRRIPLTMFSPSQQRQLRKDIAQFAPHLNLAVTP